MSKHNDSLPDNPFGEEEEVRSIEDLIREDQEAEKKEDEILESEKKQGHTKKIVFGSLGVLALCGIVVGGVLFNPFDNDQKVGTNNVSTVAPSDNGGSDDENVVNVDLKDSVKVDDFYLEEGRYFPAEVNEWAKTEYSSEIESEITENVITTAEGSEWGISSNLLPSEAGGYTSDDSKQFLEDGTINPDYSFWTAEVFQKESTIAMERLLNPTFGGWGVYQYPAYSANTEYDQLILGDLFTNNWKTANQEKAYSDYIPIYADWNADNYGGQENLLVSGPRWHGDIVDSSTEFVYDETLQQYSATVTANVKFTAWSQEQTTLEKNGVLTIKFVANANGEGDGLHKVLIDEASLKVDN